MASVLHLIKTKAYKNDSRLLKWLQSLAENNLTSSVFILEDENQQKEWKVGDVEIKSIRLFWRKYFKQRKGYIFKIPEFTYKTLRFVKHSEEKILVFHDVQHYLTLFILALKKSNQKIVWDLHELPHSILARFYLTRKFVRFLLNSVDVLIYTNEERRNYMLKVFKHKELEFQILNNFPNSAYLNHPRSTTPKDLADWLKNEPYIIWLGNALPNRNFLTLLEVMKHQKNPIKLVILGNIDSFVQNKIIAYQLKNYIYDTFVNPRDMVNYIDPALFSIVFYKNSSPNNWLCEPNRLYQLTTRNTPVIVGNNPVLKNFVTKYNAGIILEDDGTNPPLLADAINQMHLDHASFQKNLLSSHITKEVNWENQFKNILKSLSKFEVK